jgi:hypothetical protein
MCIRQHVRYSGAELTKKSANTAANSAYQVSAIVDRYGSSSINYGINYATGTLQHAHVVANACMWIFSNGHRRQKINKAWPQFDRFSSCIHSIMQGIFLSISTCHDRASSIVKTFRFGMRTSREDVLY